MFLDNKFVIGIGSQRAGSTLLHRILDASTSIYMHPMKELHYFDTLFGVRPPEVLKKYASNQLEREIGKICTATQFGFVNKRYKNYIRTAMLGAIKDMRGVNYKDLFRPCLATNPVLSETTPEYMLLPPDGINSMANEVGKDAVIILLARNPTERLISAFKLYKIGLGEFEIPTFEKDLKQTLTEASAWLDQQDAFNDYQTALEKYRSVFSRVIFLKYDDLFEKPDEVIGKLEKEAGINVSSEAYKSILGSKVNSLADTAPVSAALRAEISNRYANQQTFLTDQFGSACQH
jgi:Sulfotransferase family